MKSKSDKKNVFYLGLVSFFTDVSSEMIFPILPIFLTTILKANMTIVGFIEGIAESLAAILKLLSGWISDKLKKRKFLVIGGYSLSTITKPVLAITTSWIGVLGVRVFDRIGKGIRTVPRDALIAASVDKKARGKFFGFHRAMDTSGAILGTIIAAVLIAIFTTEAGFRLVFWLSFIPGLIAVLILFTKVKDVEEIKKIQKKEEKPKTFKLRFKGMNVNFKKFIFIITLFNLANFSYAFFLLRAKDVGLGIALIPIIYLVYNVFYAALSIPAGRLSDVLGRNTVLAIGFFLFGIMSIGFAFFANLIIIWILFVIYGLFMALTDGVSRAYVSDLVKEEKRGIALGTYHTIVGITVFPANFIGGILWNSINVAAPFLYAAVLSILASLLMITLIKKD